MKVEIVGKEVVSYTKKDTGELKEGISLHYMAPKNKVQGFATDTLWIGKTNMLYNHVSQMQVNEPVTANLVYEMQPGSRYPRLVDIEV